jgi:hypothetical protein
MRQRIFSVNGWPGAGRHSLPPRPMYDDAGGAMTGAMDQADATGTLPQSVRRDFSGIGYEEAMRRAREIVQILR